MDYSSLALRGDADDVSPLYALMALEYFDKSFPHRQDLPREIFMNDSSLALRVEAHTTKTEASVGCWLPVKCVDGAINIWNSFCLPGEPFCRKSTAGTFNSILPWI